MGKMKSTCLILAILLSATLLSPSWANGATQTWSFVVMGDTRDRTTATATGISPDLHLLATAIAAEKPDLVIHTGDLTNGYFTDNNSPVNNNFREMFQNWKSAVQPIFDYRTAKGIPIFLVRGNHEDGKLFTDSKLEKAYQDEFATLMPQNGPDREKGLTYVLSHKGARFIALDGYKKKYFGVVRGYVNQKWLDATLASDRRPFTFVFSHTPAFKVGNRHASPFPDLYSHTRRRDDLWKSFKSGGAIAYLCGHIHLYSRGTVDGIEQVVVGNGGADTVTYDPAVVDPRIAMHYPSAPMAAADVRPGYLVMTVNERSGKVTGVQKLWDGQKGVWIEGDIFTLRVPR